MGRKNRVLEELPIASPLEPRQSTAAGPALQEVDDQRTIALLKYRLGPKRYCKRTSEQFFYAAPPEVVVTAVDPAGVNGNPQPLVDANADGNVVDEAGVAETAAVNGGQTFTSTASRAAGAAKEARAHEDLDRLHKAQAMHTFTEVSILEFEPRPPDGVSTMAVRKRKRREEHGKNNGKRKEKEDAVQLLLQQQNGNGNGTMTRRSARANGLGLDIRITDLCQVGKKVEEAA
ncbi:hypothetical protein M378DRAFT_14470 [Amanita muscaria Koide BX008]|uniref:Uncharacterized protein n=1 Tax=Amanita muscaria (strain Koide BX008) TaxID=946122 RepID=A0A0C2SAQ4_AMAMK|nr:hypothetical protein M378DRAFT_17654 [Amanita muscaria Koide BX008]KIL59905.1 hypothetical protein M378DRAFT_14470 [Amanita muscaria Koide BX008]